MDNRAAFVQDAAGVWRLRRPDWVEDDTLSREETLAHLEALNPTMTEGPRDDH